MKPIKVFNNFFSLELHNKIWNILRGPGWALNGGIPDHPFWHIDGLENNKFFSEYLLEIIRDNLDINSKCLRIYANGQTAGQCGSPHTDDGTYTFLYFVNPEWEINWQGHLMFVNKFGPPYDMKDETWYDWEYNYNQDEDEITQMVTYKPNRAVLFPADMLHYADAPHSLYSGLRVSLAYKFYDEP